ncbi:MAG TPA: polymer-forming cytoskeletal protein [Terriglobales bacterium]|jgi:cytoskeletal protein CcmA (bactofilin family)
METPKPQDSARGEMANIGKSVVIKGELSGSEDLFIDGQVDGTIELKGNRLIVGPSGRIKANVNARSVVVQGRLEGNVQASDRVDLKQSAVVMGDIATQRISIEEGAYFKGGVDIQKELSGAGSRESRPATAAVGASSGTPRT